MMQSAFAQMDANLVQTARAKFRTLYQLKGAVDLTPFRKRFAGNDKDHRLHSMTWPPT